MAGREFSERPPPDIETFGSGEGGPGVPGPGRARPGAGAGVPRPAGAGMNLDSPFKVKPPRGIDFNPGGFGVGYTNANTPAVVAGTVYTIPANTVGVIRSVVITVNGLLLTSRLRWRLRFNQAPVPGWENLTITPGAVAYFVYSWVPAETYPTVPPDTTIDIEFLVQPADAGTYLAGAAYHGWFFDKGLADRWERAYQL